MKLNKLLERLDSELTASGQPKGLTLKKILDAWDASSYKKKLVKEYGKDIPRSNMSLNDVMDTEAEDTYFIETTIIVSQHGGERESIDVNIEFTFKNGVVKIKNFEVSRS
jgi:hypothetical protein